jgi:hypothetical protein
MAKNFKTVQSNTASTNADTVRNKAIGNGAGQPDPKPTSEAPDPFDPAALRLDPSFESPGVKKLLMTVPVKKPSSQHFVRVHSDLEFRGNFAVIDLKDDREVYLLTPAAAAQLPGEYKQCMLFTSITRQGTIFLWPVTLPGSDGKTNEWHRSAAEAAALAQERWIRVKANMNLGAYEIYAAEAPLPDPEWPDYTFRELLRTAFKDRFVDSLDHPVIKKLRGLI